MLMTIRKGESWGDLGPLPANAVEVHTDAELSELINRCRAGDEPVPPVALLGGDLMRSVGGRADRTRLDGDLARLPADIIRVTTDDGRTGWFAAHLVARRWWWTGELWAAMNAEHIGRWDVAPRSHPNDGRVDVIRVAGSMSVRNRVQARTRVHTGSHVPHPDIELRQRSDATATFDRPLRLWLDGRPWGRARSVQVTVEPDAIMVCV